MIKELIKLVKRVKRRGQGYGSGKGGHTVGRGQKGQRSRGKGKPGIMHEGGRIPIHRKIPKNRGRGFKPVHEYTSVNLKTLAVKIEKAGLKIRVINPKILQQLGFRPSKDGYKIYGRAEVKHKFKLAGVKFTKGVKDSLGL